MRSKRRRQLPDPFEVTIEGLSHEGRGICHHNGKVVFVFAALPGERVRVQINRSTKKYSEASVLEVLQASARRIIPRCPHFSVCGGCSMQHIATDDQLELKQRALLEMMHHAGVDVGEVLPPLKAEDWGYRRKARLGVKYVQKKQRLLIGFRERNKPYLADMQTCPVLVPQVGEHLQDLIDLVSQLDARATIPQIEVAADDEHTLLVFRHLQDLSAADRLRLVDFARTSGLWVALQPQGPDSIQALYPEHQQLYFEPLLDADIRIGFSASDFTQVNNGINQQMVARALEMLDLQADDQVLDLFCGLGNFTLPIAQRSGRVTGIEGSETMVQRARASAQMNAVSNVEFYAADLSDQTLAATWLKRRYDKVLLDPPRSGALEMVTRLAAMRPAIIVYISCQPSSLVRDAQVLTAAGYRLSRLGLMDMFPQTAHVESMAVFELP